MSAEPRGADLERMREIAAKSNDIDDLGGTIFDLCTHAESLAAEVARLEGDLKKYGQHKPACLARPQIVTGVVGYPLPELEMGPCDCGFAAALAPTCKRGHPRSEFGLWQTRLSRSNPNPYWQCRACIEAYRAADREGTRARAQERKAAALGTKGAE